MGCCTCRHGHRTGCGSRGPRGGRGAPGKCGLVSVVDCLHSSYERPPQQHCQPQRLLCGEVGSQSSPGHRHGLGRMHFARPAERPVKGHAGLRVLDCVVHHCCIAFGGVAKCVASRAIVARHCRANDLSVCCTLHQMQRGKQYQIQMWSRLPLLCAICCVAFGGVDCVVRHCRAPFFRVCERVHFSVCILVSECMRVVLSAC